MGTPYITVTLEQTRDSWEALLKELEKIPSTYTPLGIGAMNLAEKIKTALGDSELWPGAGADERDYSPETP